MFADPSDVADVTSPGGGGRALCQELPAAAAARGAPRLERRRRVFFFFGGGGRVLGASFLSECVLFLLFLGGGDVGRPLSIWVFFFDSGGRVCTAYLGIFVVFEGR